MSDAFTLRPITPADDAAVAGVIRSVMPEFGASGPGFAIHDPEVDAMCAAYDRPGAAYFVIEADGDGGELTYAIASHDCAFTPALSAFCAPATANKPKPAASSTSSGFCKRVIVG